MGGHAPVLDPDCGNLYAVLTTLTSVLGKGCLHTAIGSRTLSLPPLIYSWYYELCFLISLLAVKCIHVCSKPPYHVCMVLVRRISQYSCQVLLEVLSASFPQLVCDHAQQRAKLEVGFSAINSLYTFNPY